MPNGISHDATEMEKSFYRANNLIAVTLKHTRTGDVFISIIQRLTLGYEAGIDELIKFDKGDESLSYEEKIAWCKQKIPSMFDEHFNEYRNLMKLLASKLSGASIGVDEVTNYYRNAIEFCKLVLQHIGKPLH